MDFRSRGQTTHNSSPASFPSNSKDVPQRARMAPRGAKHCTSLQVKCLRAARGGRATLRGLWVLRSPTSAGGCRGPRRTRQLGTLPSQWRVQAGARERCKPISPVPYRAHSCCAGGCVEASLTHRGLPLPFLCCLTAAERFHSF